MPSRVNPDIDIVAEGAPDDRLGALHERYSGPLKAYFRKRTPAHVDPDDLVQDVFARLAGRGSTKAIHHVEGYLFQTAANVLCDLSRRDAARHNRAHNTFDESVHGSEEISPERVYQGREAAGALLDALEVLPERARAVFVLHRFNGMRYGEIANHFGISVSTVEKHMMKALARVAHCMDKLP